MDFKPLKIGDLVAKIPIIQGGMGIGVSLSGLAGAVASEGGIGVISSAQIGFADKLFGSNPPVANLSALARHIKNAKKISNDGLIGVNIMTALQGFSEHVKCCVENKADLIISGAGLPVNLPELVKNAATKIAPIVSSVKAVSILLRAWEKRYNSTADAVVVEGPKAGGHLGFKAEEIEKYTAPHAFDAELTGIINLVKDYENKFQKHIPVIFGGGVFDRQDIEHAINLGCDGVQIASRFVATEECDAHINFKNAYVSATKETIGIIKSPVGMPGRAVINEFVRKLTVGNRVIGKCHQCLNHCDRATIPFCITEALVAAVKGDVSNGLIFCGENTWRIDKIISVKELLAELT